jgi:hypothetical protein
MSVSVSAASIGFMDITPSAMPEADWRLIDVLGGSTEQDDVERLTDVLRTGGREQAVAFQERLAATLHDLDREVLFRQGVRFVGDPPDSAVVPSSSDSFLHLHAGIVAKGRRVVEQVLADPAVPTAWQWEDCEVLLYAAEEAAGGQIETALSYETGENADHWAAGSIDAGEDPAPAVVVQLVDHLTPVEPHGHPDLPVPDEGVVFSWHVGFPNDVHGSTREFVALAVEDGDGLDAGPQVQVYVSLGDAWRLTPRTVPSHELGRWQGVAVEVGVDMDQTDFRSWTGQQQTTALKAVVATCLLAVLPDDHAGRPALEEAVSAGADVLPAR